jgi:hypothetical protein
VAETQNLVINNGNRKVKTQEKGKQPGGKQSIAPPPLPQCKKGRHKQNGPECHAELPEFFPLKKFPHWKSKSVGQCPKKHEHCGLQKHGGDDYENNRIHFEVPE